MYAVDGRVKGYADEVEWFVRSCETFVSEVKQRRPHTEMRFERGREITLGTVGWFNKRIVKQIEYSLYYDCKEQGKPISEFMQYLASRLS